jgi:hypothetical protein
MPEPGEEKCVVCEEAITNPICLNCLEEEVKQWLVDKKKTQLSPLLAQHTEVFRAFKHRGVDCIKCSGNMNVCAHCYTKEIYGWFRQDIRQFSDEFLDCFDFEIRQIFSEGKFVDFEFREFEIKALLSG